MGGRSFSLQGQSSLSASRAKACANTGFSHMQATREWSIVGPRKLNSTRLLRNMAGILKKKVTKVTRVGKTLRKRPGALAKRPGDMEKERHAGRTATRRAVRSIVGHCLSGLLEEAANDEV
eukprot:3879936-Rhodomonas_salina.3